MSELRAFLLAPMPAAAIGASVSFGGLAHPLSVFVFYLLIFYLFQALIGRPIRAYFARRNFRSLPAYALVGTIMTGLPSLAYITYGFGVNPGNTLSMGMYLLGLWSALGTITGVTYWFVSRSLSRSTIDSPPPIEADL